MKQYVELTQGKMGVNPQGKVNVSYYEKKEGDVWNNRTFSSLVGGLNSLAEDGFELETIHSSSYQNKDMTVGVNVEKWILSRAIEMSDLKSVQQKEHFAAQPDMSPSE